MYLTSNHKLTSNQICYLTSVTVINFAVFWFLVKMPYFTPVFSQIMRPGNQIFHFLCLKWIEINVTLWKLTCWPKTDRFSYYAMWCVLSTFNEKSLFYPRIWLKMGSMALISHCKRSLWVKMDVKTLKTIVSRN